MSADLSSHTAPRFAQLSIIFILGGAVLAGRLYWLQVIEHERMVNQLRQKLTRTAITLTGRGSILERGGTVLAEDVPGYQLAVVPGELPLEMGATQEIEYALYPKKRKYTLLYRGGIQPTPKEELKHKLEDLEPRLMQENLVQDLAKLCNLPQQKIASAIVGTLQNCLQGWYYLSDTQPLDFFVDRHIAARILTDRGRFAGVLCLESAIRRYPYGELAAHVVGYLGRLSAQDYLALRAQGSYTVPGVTDQPVVLNDVERFSLSWVRNFLVGMSGAELAWNNDLRGQLGRVRRARSFTGGERILEEEVAENGKEIRLTLDADLQRVAEKAMAGQRGASVLFDLDTGDMLVSTSLPAFDPNRFTPPADGAYIKDILGEPGVFVNKAVAASYPFGSVFKIITATAALEDHLIDADKTFVCEHVHARTHLKCLGHHGPIAVEEALERSCNIFFYEAGLALGDDRLHEWSLRFGLGQSLATGLPSEKAGVVPSRAFKLQRYGEMWYGGDTANLAIGQGYQLGTPLQAALVAGLISRAGEIALPRYRLDHPIRKMKLDLSATTREVVLRGLYRVVNHPGGTAFAHRSSLLDYAGKTGTADIVSVGPGHPRYKPPHAWFAGFAPFGHPRVAVAVLIENGGHGGETAAPVAKAILEAWSRKYNFALPRVTGPL